MSQRPLAGRRVIELGTMIAAPFATHILSQLGAEVIKIEPPSGDTTRALVRGGPSGTFLAYNHGKKSFCIDLARPDGLEAFRRLVATADILVHNLAPSTTHKLRITAEDLAEVNPTLLSCHIRGYAAGPQHDDLATNPVAEAATGVMDDHRINGRPSRLGPSYHDQFAGAYAVIRILSLLLDPPARIEDRRIEIGLYETGLHVAGRDLAGVQLKMQLLGRPEKEGGGEFSMPGYGAYETRDGRWLYLLVLTDAHWAKLTRALAMPEAGDPGLERLRERKKAEVVPLERVLDAPQARHPGKLRAYAYRGLGFEIPEFPGGSADEPSLPPPEIGAHSIELMTALGLDETQRATLLAAGAVVAGGPDHFPWAPVRQKG